MLLITDRLAEARALQQTLQQVQPCTLAALHHVEATPVDHPLIVCDVALDLPKSVETLCAALARHRQSRKPVLFLLRDPSHVTHGQARLAGATATLEHPFEPVRLLAAVTGLIDTRPPTADAETSTAPVTAGVRNAGKVLTSLFQSGASRQPISAERLDQGGAVLLDVIRQAKVQAWLDVVWKYDDSTYQHCLLVAGLTAAFALELGLPPKAQHVLSQAALVHDIGKAQIPRQILNKAGRLSPGEMAIMRSHAVAGYRMLANQPGLDRNLLDVTRHHHEYLDGSGYPDGLNGAQIPRMVRIVTVCDIYAALIERRPYKKPYTPKAALDHLEALGPRLDQALVKAFRNVMRDA